MLEEIRTLSPYTRSTLRGALFLFQESQQVLDGEKAGNITDARTISEIATVAIAKYAPATVPVLQQLWEDEWYTSSSSLTDKKMPSNVYVATVGLNNVGKGAVTTNLQNNYGFRAHPLSDRIVDIANALGYPEPHNRDVLIEVGKQVKSIFGPMVLIRHAIALFTQPGVLNKLLFDGLRVEGEATGLLDLKSIENQIACIAITTGVEDAEEDLQIRYRRSLKRGGSKDPKEDTREAFEQFRQLNDRESPGILAAMKHATHTIINREGDLPGVIRQVERVMLDLGVKAEVN